MARTNFIFKKTFNSEYSDIEVWFTDQTSQPLETEDRINWTLIIKDVVIIKMHYWIKTRDQIYVKDYRLLSFANNMSDKYSQKPLDAAK